MGRWKDPAARQALLLALEPYQDREWSPAARRALSALLSGLVRDGRIRPNGAAVEWLLRRWGDEDGLHLGPLPPRPASSAHGRGPREA